MINLEKIIDYRNFIATDAALKTISARVILVSSKQLAKFLGKKNDNSLRAQRSKRAKSGKKLGFNYYKTPDGEIFYNLIEVLNDMGIEI